jgi:uncharacterized protein
LRAIRSAWRLLASDVEKMDEMVALNVRALTRAVLPGATATEFWNVVGMPIENLPPQWVMSAEDLVDAALAGFDLGEVVTIPALPDSADWQAFEAARAAMGPKLSNSKPAQRYRIVAKGALVPS